MSKYEFLNTLEGSLRGIPYEDKRDIMYDYEEHFRIGNENGKTEHEIATSLGDPKTIAKLYRANYTLEKARSEPSSKNILRAIFAAISLGFLNLVFVLGPFIGICAVIIALFAAAAAVTGSGIIIFLSSFIPNLMNNVHIDNSFVIPAAALFIGIGITALGALFFIGVVYLAKYFYKGTMKYLNWNISIIKDKKEC